MLNLDDAFGAQPDRRVARARARRVIGYGFGARATCAATRASVAIVDARHRVRRRDAVGRRRSSSAAASARFNAANLLGVLGVLLASGVAARRRARGARARSKPVAGRMRALGGGDASRWSSSTTRTRPMRSRRCCARAAARRVRARGASSSCVFGCGGDRDRGQAAADGRDRRAGSPTAWSSPATTRAARIRTRSSTPSSQGIREAAIALTRRARSRARRSRGASRTRARGDVVLIAGKGHETYQEIAGERHPFSDAAVARGARSRERAR